MESQSIANQLKEQGNQLAKKNDYQAALQKYNEAIKANPNFTQAWFNKGLMHKSLKQYTEAFTAFEKTLAIDPDYLKAKLNQAEILRLQVKYQEAWQLFHSISHDKSHSAPIEATIGQFYCEQYMAAKIIFANVDLKFTKDNKIKILEFGRGMQSGFVGLKLATEQEISNLLHKKIKQLSLPPLILNSSPGSDNSDHSLIKKVLSNLPQPQGEFLPESIASYCAIYGGAELRLVDERILIMDDSVVNFIFEDKKLTHEAFIAADMEDARPKTLILERKFHWQLANSIRQQLSGVKRFVLKVPDLEGGKGVIIVDEGDLEVTLNCLLLSPDNKIQIASFWKQYADHFKNKPYFSSMSKDEVLKKSEEHMDRFEIWNTSNSSHFMVEEYITNKPIFHKEKIYDATMRVAFLFIRNGNGVQCEPFACYWKLPPQPINDRGQLRDKTVSSFSETRHDSTQVNKEDCENVYQQLKHTLPNVILNMLKKDIPAYIESKTSSFQDEKIYKANLYMHFANSLAHQGHYTLSEYYLNTVKNLVPNYYKVYHELGVFYHLKELYTQAIGNYTQALAKQSNVASTYYRRGKTWLALNNFEKANQDFKKAIEIVPYYRQQIFVQLENYKRKHSQLNIGDNSQKSESLSKPETAYVSSKQQTFMPPPQTLSAQSLTEEEKKPDNNTDYDQMMGHRG